MNSLGKNMNQAKTLHKIKLIPILTILRLRGEKKKLFFYLLTDAPSIWKHQNITAGTKALKMQQNWKIHSGATSVQVYMKGVGEKTLCFMYGGQSKSARQEGSVCLPRSHSVL